MQIKKPFFFFIGMLMTIMGFVILLFAMFQQAVPKFLIIFAWIMIMPSAMIQIIRSVRDCGGFYFPDLFSFEGFYIGVGLILFMITATIILNFKRSDCINKIELGADLGSCEFIDQVLDDTDFGKTDLGFSNFSGASIRNSNFMNADLSFADFSYTNASGADFSNANLKSTNFTGADLTNAVFSGASLFETEFTQAIGFSDEILIRILDIDEKSLPETLSQKRILLESEWDIQKALGTACLGVAEPDAAAYQENGFNAISLSDENGSYHSWKDDFDDHGWSASAVRFGVLALCIGDEEMQKVGSCRYTDLGTTDLYQRTLTARIVQARTGEILDERIFSGSKPACPELHNDAREIGTHVELEDMVGWINSYVHASLK